MARESKLHYIAPSAISIIPNANGSANDLAVSVAKEAKIKVYCPGVGIGTVNADYQEWALSGRNRRLADSTKPYTIYARLTKTGEKKGYLIFAAKVQQGNEWIDRYASITATGGGMTEAYWYVRLGDVTLPEGGKRTVTIDTGILGTDQYNSEWELEPDELPLRIELGCTVNGEDVGATPYIYWGQALAIQARLVEGWDTDANDRIDHWTIARNTGNATADATWNGSADGRTMTNGQITLSHARGSGDDFGAAVAANFTITAWGADTDSSSATIVPLAAVTITVLAETVERYELVFSTPIVNYSPQSETYSPAEGVLLRIRATDQKGEVFYMTNAQRVTAGLHVMFVTEGVSQDDELDFNPGAADAVANATVPITAFYAEKNVELRLVNATNDELAIGTIAFVRDGEDSRVREWIYKRSTTAAYGTAPANISQGEVRPGGVANGTETNKDQEDWVPNGWTDEPQGVDGNNQYEFAAYRDYVTDANAASSSSGDDGGHWGDFTTPKIWSHYANDAIVYSIDTNIDSIRIASGAASASAELEAYFYQKVGKNQKVAAYIYYAICKVAANGTRTQLLLGRGDPSITYSVTVSAGEKVEIFVWESEFVSDAAYTNYAAKKEILVIQDGQDGSNGYNGDTPINCYRWYKEGLIPTKPTSTISDTPDAVDYINDNTKAQPILIWDSAAPERPGEGWHLWMCQSVKHISASGAITRDAWTNPIRITGDEGPAGETTVVVTLSPENVILSQATSSPYGIDLTNAFTDVSVMKGNALQSDFAVAVGTGTDAPLHCSAVVDSSNNKRVKITGIQRPGGVYYDNGYVIILVTYDGVTYKKRFSFYANLLGTWKESVIGDTKTEVAASISHGYDETGTNVLTLENIGTYIKSSETNISTLQSTVGDGTGGLVKEVSEIRQTASDISLKVSQSVLANLLPDPIFKNDLGFTGTDGTSHTATVSQFDADSSQNIDDPWQGYGGRILEVDVTSVTNTGNLWLTPPLATRVKLEASKKYTFSVWVYVSDEALLGNSKTLVDISMYNQATDGNRPTQRPTITLNDATGRTAGKFVQIAKTIEVSSPYLYFSWLPLIAVAAGNPVNIQFAGAKLEVGEVATDMSFDYSSKASEAVSQLEQDLLDTGIDINHKEVLITSDNFRVQNRRGDETFYVDENGDVAIAGYLSEKINVISNVQEWMRNFLPVFKLYLLEEIVLDTYTPSTGSTTVYGQSENLTVTGYPMMMNTDGDFTPVSHNLQDMIGKHWGADAQNYGMLDLGKCTGIIDIEFQPRTSEGEQVENVVYLPWIQFNAGDDCSQVALSGTDAMAVRLAPLSGTNRYKGSQLFTNGDSEVRKFSPYTTNLRHGASAIATNKLPNNYALYFNIKASISANGGVLFSASDLYLPNQTGSEITLQSARVCYYFETNTGERTAVTSCQNAATTINLSATNIRLYAYILINGTYQTNHVLLAEYSGYGMLFLRTMTTFGNQQKHFVTYEEVLAMIGKRFVLRNNSGAEMYAVYDTGKVSGNHSVGYVNIPSNSSLGFTLVQELTDAGHIENAEGNIINLDMPKFYFRPDETDRVVIDFSQTAFNSENFGEQAFFD